VLTVENLRQAKLAERRAAAPRPKGDVCSVLAYMLAPPGLDKAYRAKPRLPLATDFKLAPGDSPAALPVAELRVLDAQRHTWPQNMDHLALHPAAAPAERPPPPASLLIAPENVGNLDEEEGEEEEQQWSSPFGDGAGDAGRRSQGDEENGGKEAQGDCGRVELGAGEEDLDPATLSLDAFHSCQSDVDSTEAEEEREEVVEEERRALEMAAREEREERRALARRAREKREMERERAERERERAREEAEERDREETRKREREQEMVEDSAPSDSEKQWQEEVKAIAFSAGWKQLDRRSFCGQHVSIYGKEDTKGNHYLKAVGVVEAPVTQVFDYVRNRAARFNTVQRPDDAAAEREKSATPDCYGISTTLKMVERTDAYRGAWYSAVGLPWPISDRDICWQTYDCLHDPGSSREIWATCLGKSVKHPNVPPRPGFTRVDMNIGHLLQVCEANPEHTNLVFVAQADLKGWIPGWAIRNAAAVQGYMVLLGQPSYTISLL